LPSETESFGLAALEAMAEGVPVVSSNTGGIPEVNVHGFSGYLSAVGNVDEMAQNALSILKDDSQLAQFSNNAFERAKTFSLSSVLPMYEELYEQVLDKMKQ
jgi:glycosyltransferase involved in cell wall biosynthesis